MSPQGDANAASYKPVPREFGSQLLSVPLSPQRCITGVTPMQAWLRQGPKDEPYNALGHVVSSNANSVVVKPK